MNNKFRLSSNQLESTLIDLKMFEQNKYCFDYIKERFSDMDDDKILEHADISSACFRQASEYLKASKSVTITTSPLLLSYSLNNLLKGTCYLKTFDDDILNGFKSHGFKVLPEELASTLLNSKINIKERGAAISLLKLFNNEINPQTITFDKLLRHIPGIEDIYFKTIGIMSLIAKRNKNDKSEYIIIGDQLTDEIKNIMQEFGLVYQINRRDKNCPCYMNKKEIFKIESGIFNEKDIYYRDYVIIPDLYVEGLKSINVAFYCYLLIMSYGMLVRYHAHIWEKFIDKKSSNEETLIELSINNSVNTFYSQIHYILFDYYYKDESYNDLDVKKVIKDSTTDIMNNITEQIEASNMRYNRHDSLPWYKGYR